jgi:hypothetical protein
VTPSYPKCKFELGKSQEGKDSYRCKEWYPTFIFMYMFNLEDETDVLFSMKLNKRYIYKEDENRCDF